MENGRLKLKNCDRTFTPPKKGPKASGDLGVAKTWPVRCFHPREKVVGFYLSPVNLYLQSTILAYDTQGNKKSNDKR